MELIAVNSGFFFFFFFVLWMWNHAKPEVIRNSDERPPVVILLWCSLCLYYSSTCNVLSAWTLHDRLRTIQLTVLCTVLYDDTHELHTDQRQPSSHVVTATPFPARLNLLTPTDALSGIKGPLKSSSLLPCDSSTDAKASALYGNSIKIKDNHNMADRICSFCSNLTFFIWILAPLVKSALTCSRRVTIHNTLYILQRLAL